MAAHEGGWANRAELLFGAESLRPTDRSGSKRVKKSALSGRLMPSAVHTAWIRCPRSNCAGRGDGRHHGAG
jgi:hypothetical protein